MTNIQVSITKLNFLNYWNWAADVKYLLLDKNAWGIVTGTEKAPDPNDAAANKDYQSRIRAAFSVIYLNVELTSDILSRTLMTHKRLGKSCEPISSLITGHVPCNCSQKSLLVESIRRSLSICMLLFSKESQTSYLQ